MHILVSGAAGFIGSHLCDALVELGHKVTGVDDLSLGREQNLQALAGNPDFTFVEADVLDRSALARLFGSADPAFEAVFHLAANSDIARSHEAPEIDLQNTFLTTFNILDAMRKAGVKQLVFASTSAIYGEVPGKIREDHGPLLPISHYGAAKLASEAFISSFGDNYGIQSWIVRFPNVVGARATHGVVYDFVQKLRRRPGRLEVLGDGNQVKPYLAVSDLVAAMLKIWSSARDRINVYNVGTFTRSMVADIARTVIEEGPRQSAEIRFTGGDRGWAGDVPTFDYDFSAVRALGWEPSMTSDEAVRAAAKAIWMEVE